MNKLRWLYMIALFFCSSTVSAQGLFLERGQNGFQTVVGFFSNNISNGFLFSGGYSYRGMFDVGFSWQGGKSGTPYHSLFSPRVTYYPLKENDTPNAPSIAINIMYNQYTITERTEVPVPTTQPVGYTMVTLTNENTYRYVTPSCGISRTIGVGKKYTFEPFSEVGFGISNKDWKFVWKIGMSAFKQIQARSLFVVTPLLQREPDATTFVLTAGIIFQ